MKTNNTTIFTQDKFNLDQDIEIEKAFGSPIFYRDYTLEDRKSTGFKFGFVVTKITCQVCCKSCAER